MITEEMLQEWEKAVLASINENIVTEISCIDGAADHDVKVNPCVRHMRDAMPRLIAEVRKLRAQLDAIQQARHWLTELEQLRKVAEEMKWIASVPQDSIFDAPEVWGKVLEVARAAIAAWESGK